MKKSAGILLYRKKKTGIELFLVHPGGPFWKNKDLGAWSLPKGEFDENEDPLAAAIREFKEETGIELEGDFIALSPIKQKSGKTVFAWGLKGDLDPSAIQSNTFTMEWPPKSGRMLTVPEVDRGEWFDEATAREKINPAQVKLIDELLTLPGI